MRHETPDETLSALDDLIDEIDYWLVEHDDYYFDPESNEELAARLADIGGCLIGYGDAAIESLKGCLYATRVHPYIIAVDVLREIGTPTEIHCRDAWYKLYA